MRIVFISDTHLLHLEENIHVPDGDMLIHAGDMTWEGKYKEIRRFNEWFRELPHHYKVLIAGNHDWDFQTNPQLAISALDPRIIYLRDQHVNIEGIRIYGTPWQPEFMHWAFNLKRYGPELKRKWEAIPEGIDILITHGPPAGVGDFSHYGNEHAGCKALWEEVTTRIKPRIHVFGHVHGGHGVYEHYGITFINASTCNERYEPVNPPIVVDWPMEGGR